VLFVIESYGLIAAMELGQYIKRLSASERASFAVDVGTTLGHLNNVAYKQRIASASLTKQIALRSGREVAEWDSRPGDWHLIWPELVGTEGAPPVPTVVEV
jgi:hypothetical protein